MHVHTLTSTVASIFPLRPNLASLVNTSNSTSYTYRGLHMHSSISCTPDTPTWQLVIHWLSSWQFGVLLDHYITVLKITRYRIPSELNLSFTRYGDVIHELFYPVKQHWHIFQQLFSHMILGHTHPIPTNIHKTITNDTNSSLDQSY